MALQTLLGASPKSSANQSLFKSDGRGKVTTPLFNGQPFAHSDGAVCVPETKKTKDDIGRVVLYSKIIRKK
jgi:hypothetical protein